ncbi:hypothetical protein BCR42DRAFT_425699 [Absidia repens]|uniref:FAD-binding FR-type domain-containing protein n=1 Tax=Absidia repens TaxID=90262 RepID=A0A1X2I2F5_9FUNG|nr:hypothetical protein BCR42DRAFT_425699 [Absidia repens]
MNRTWRSGQRWMKFNEGIWKRYYNNNSSNIECQKPQVTRSRLFGLGGCIGLVGYGGWHWYQQQQKGRLDSDWYIPLELVNKTMVSHDTVKIRLETKKKNEPYPVPSCVYIKDDAIQVMRPYTPINADPYQDGYIDLIVKRYPNGSVSRTLAGYPLHEPVFVRGPMTEEYQYTQNTLDEVGMIAGGTGISPMYQVIKRILEDDHDTQSKLWLIYANKGNLDALAEQHKDRFKVMYVLEQPPTDWKEETGRVTATMVKSLLHDNNQTGENGNKHRRLVMVCGPDGMLNSICGQRARDYTQGSLTGILAQLGLTAKEVWKFQ